MSDTTDIQYNLVLNTLKADTEARKLEIVLYRCLVYAQRLTGDPNLIRGMQIMQKAITTLKTLQATIRAVQIASGPIGWAYAATSIVAAGIASSELIMDLGGT